MTVIAAEFVRQHLALVGHRIEHLPRIRRSTSSILRCALHRSGGSTAIRRTTRVEQFLGLWINERWVPAERLLEETNVATI